ncbi:MAG TPA: tetratricopeptide repeat protein [Candidatus Saccharimonadales bacterium]|jgi:tetratricopeptide (TPR) repeat protein|nr:tetratricopeptide repeat protein [Candidatus Saccharimonadales bacterium]
MISSRVALPVSFLLVSLTLPSIGQTSDDTPKESFVPPMQTQSQVSNAAANPAERQLSGEQMGDLYMARKQYREAMEQYRTLSEQNPRNAVYLNKLGIALHQQTVLGLALKYYERAVKVDPRYADAQNNIGTIWYQRKKYGKAVRAYQKAIKMRDDMPVLYSNLGYAYFSQGKYDDSIAAFRTALAKDPQFFERGSSRNGSVLQDRSVPDRGRFYFLLAKSFAEAGNLERAVFYLRKSKEEGYTKIDDVKKDPAFAALLQDPVVIDLLTPKPVETAQP